MPASLSENCPDHARLIVDLAALTANYRLLRDKTVGVSVGAAVKANAYGLGMVPVAHALAAAGCRHFFVAHFSEGLALRKAFATEGLVAQSGGVEILVLHGLAPGGERPEVWCEARLIPVLSSLAMLDRWRHAAHEQEHRLPAYIHLDTGMNRLGLAKDEQARLVETASIALEGIEVKAWLSHLACADEPGHPLNENQLRDFLAVTAKLPSAPRTLANSSGIFLGPAWHFDLVRPGAALYGINPLPESTNPMQSVVRLQAPVLSVHAIDTGASVGYGATHTSMRPARLATLALGYADGWSRALSGRWSAAFGDWLAPLVGRVSMDLVVADVTDVPESLVYPGCYADIMDAKRGVDEVARVSGTIGYEVLTSLGSRVERVYRENGKQHAF